MGGTIYRFGIVLRNRHLNVGVSDTVTAVLELEIWNRPGRYATCQPVVVEGTGDVGISSDSIGRGQWFAGDGILGGNLPGKVDCIMRDRILRLLLGTYVELI